MSSTVSIICFIFSVLVGNILCADISNRNTQQNPWQRLNTSNYDYNTQGKSSTTPWPELGRRNQQNNVQTTRSPLWVRPNNGPNWVRNTPTPQKSNLPSQNSNPPPQNSNQRPQNSNPPSQNSNLRPQNANPPLQNSNLRPQSANPPPQNSNPPPQNSNLIPQNANPPAQNSNLRPQNSNSSPQQNVNNIRPQDRINLFLNNERNAFTSNTNTGFNKGASAFVNLPNENNYPRSNSEVNPFSSKWPNTPNQNTGGTNGNSPRPNGGVNTVISSGSVLTNSEDIGRKDQGRDSSQNSGDVDDNELRQFSEDLLNKDTNNAAQYVSVNFQGMTSSRSTKDEAPLPLLSINQAAYSIPSISKLMLLYNNYIVEANQNEVYTAQEKNEENDLLDVVLQTPVMQHTRNFLISKGKIGKDPQEFKELLRLIWFNMYSRGGGRIGSSGFEHVFLAELKNNDVSGLHSWIYFNEEEKKNNANYLGYMKKIDLGGKGSILKFHFTFQNVDKPVGSMFIGTSPELEMALYSACFIIRPDRVCPLKMNGNRFIIRTYTYRYRGKNMIGSAFPEI